MGSKNITISDNAYRFLKRLKGEKKSFSDVILSLQKKRQNIMSYAGLFKNADLAAVEKIRTEMRKWRAR